MCLSVPGKIIAISGNDPLTRSARVSFGGTMRDVNLAYVPDARTGDYVIVHVGFALNIIDEKEAEQMFRELKEIENLSGKKYREIC